MILADAFAQRKSILGHYLLGCMIVMDLLDMSSPLWVKPFGVARAFRSILYIVFATRMLSSIALTYLEQVCDKDSNLVNWVSIPYS